MWVVGGLGVLEMQFAGRKKNRGCGRSGGLESA
jgi:hypothetical protein